MVIIPFIYFTLLTIYWWKKHEAVDICVYMSGLYAFSAFCSVCLVYGDMLDSGGVLYDRWNVELNLIPTVVYCAAHTICLLPFSLIYKKDLKAITEKQTWIIDLVSYFLIAVALLNFYVVADSTLEILSGDLATVRIDHYNGIESPAQIKIASMSFAVQFMYYFNLSTIIALPIMFYNIYTGRKPWWFNIILFFTSLSVPIAGLQAVDRTETILYAQMFVFCVIFFWRLVSRRFKIIMSLCSIPFTTIVMTYLVAVSVARFDEHEGGATEKAIQYAGQSYINFCYFWEYHKPNYIEAEREFPFIHHYIFNTDSTPERRGERSGRQGFFISVFPTYLGDILLDLSIMGMVMWVIIFFIITTLVIKRAHREEINVGEAVTIFIIGIIPTFGIFYYKYYMYHYTLMLMLTVLIYIFSKYRIIIYSDENIHNNSDMERNETPVDREVSDEPATKQC